MVHGKAYMTKARNETESSGWFSVILCDLRSRASDLMGSEGHTEGTRLSRHFQTKIVKPSTT